MRPALSSRCTRLSIGQRSRSLRLCHSILAHSVRLGSSIVGHPTRPLCRPQTIKPNPYESQPGQFDRSFENMTGTLESRMIFTQHNFVKGCIYDVVVGEESQSQLKRVAEQQYHGREEAKPAARAARSYFTDADLSPEALHVRSPNLKVAQHAARQAYDENILKVSREEVDFYYAPDTMKQCMQRRAGILACIVGACTMTLCGWRRLSSYMRD